MLKVAATLIFTGNSLTASDAFPSNNISSFSTSRPSDFGDFLVVRRASKISPMAAALIPSIPTIAPVGA